MELRIDDYVLLTDQEKLEAIHKSNQIIQQHLRLIALLSRTSKQ